MKLSELVKKIKEVNDSLPDKLKMQNFNGTIDISDLVTSIIEEETEKKNYLIHKYIICPCWLMEKSLGYEPREMSVQIRPGVPKDNYGSLNNGNGRKYKKGELV